MRAHEPAGTSTARSTRGAQVTSSGRLRGLAVCAAIIGGLLVPVALATPASAATVCSSDTLISHGSLTFNMPTIGNNTGKINCFLESGDNSEAVKTLQSNLNDCYWSGSTTRGHQSKFSPKLELDGDFGGLTKAALTAAQKTVSTISHDGVYGSETRANINFFADDGGIGHCARFGS
ncbi:MAG: peptidoglycan-binding protein [Labedaea sp.]